MKKFAIFTVFALALGAFSPALPAAHAAGGSVSDQILAQAATKYPEAAKVQDLIRLRETLAKGNSSEMLGKLASAAAQQVGRGDLATVAATAATGGNVGAAIQTAISQSVEQKLTEKLGPYKEALTLLNSLLVSSKLNPQVAKDSNALAGAPTSYKKVLDMNATAYGPGKEDNGKWGNLTYLGGQVRKGVAAVDPRVIPLGTKLWIDGYGPAVAEDEGGAIVGNRIDLAFDTRKEALDFGMKPAKVYVLN